MKNIIAIAILSLITFASCKQDVKNTETQTVEQKAPDAEQVKTIALTQVTGEFETKSLTLDEGTYVFEIANKNVDHSVGFVLAPKGKTDPANHIKAAYVKSPVAAGGSSLTNEVKLTKGEYVYFCPLNPTPEYSLMVK